MARQKGFAEMVTLLEDYTNDWRTEKSMRALTAVRRHIAGISKSFPASIYHENCSSNLYN